MSTTCGVCNGSVPDGAAVGPGHTAVCAEVIRHNDGAAAVIRIIARLRARATSEQVTADRYPIGSGKGRGHAKAAEVLREECDRLDDLSCPGCVEDAVEGADGERSRVLAIVHKAMMSPKLKPGTRMALAIVARRIQDPKDDADPLCPTGECKGTCDPESHGL